MTDDDLKTAKTALAKLHQDMESINKLAKPYYLRVIKQDIGRLIHPRRGENQVPSSYHAAWWQYQNGRGSVGDL
jgi:hypothetical protein